MANPRALTSMRTASGPSMKWSTNFAVTPPDRIFEYGLKAKYPLSPYRISETNRLRGMFPYLAPGRRRFVAFRTAFDNAPSVRFERFFPVDIDGGVVEDKTLDGPGRHVPCDVRLRAGRASIRRAKEAVYICGIERTVRSPNAEIRLDMRRVHWNDVHAEDVFDAQFVSKATAIVAGARSIDERSDAISF